MWIYHWHPHTHEWLGSSDADENPLEPGTYLIPAYATTLKPPERKKNGRILWDGTQWIIVQTEGGDGGTGGENGEKHPMDLLRLIRNAKLAEVDWITLRAYSRGEPVPYVWSQYMQALRDLPARSNPRLDPVSGRLDMASIDWPLPPDAFCQ